MFRPFFLLGPTAALVIVTAACSSSASPYGAAPSYGPVSPSPTATVAASPAAGGTVIQAGSSRLGQILVDAKGRTVYLFAADRGTTSVCNSAACVQYWPPVLTTGAPVAGQGANASLLSTTARQDGTVQVTYAGHPLYYFITDKKPGDVTGQGIDGFGGPWWVISPNGTKIG